MTSESTDQTLPGHTPVEPYTKEEAQQKFPFPEGSVERNREDEIKARHKS